MKSLKESKKRRPKEIKITNEKFPNIVNRNFKPQNKNKYWHIDVSYIKVNKIWMYLSIIIDSYNNEILDWKLSKYHDTNLALNNFKDAISKHGTPQIIHSDHGFEYKSHKFVNFCEKNKIQISMSRIGNSLDNRPAEFFFSQIKRECIKINKFKTKKRLLILIEKYIHWYNCFKIQSNLNWQNPINFVR